MEIVSPQSTAVGSNKIGCKAPLSRYNGQESLNQREMNFLLEEVDASSLALRRDTCILRTLILEVKKQLTVRIETAGSSALSNY